MTMTEDELADIITRTKAEELTPREIGATRDLVWRAGVALPEHEISTVALLMKIDRRAQSRARMERWLPKMDEIREVMERSKEVLAREDAPSELSPTTEPSPAEANEPESGSSLIYLSTLSA